MKNINDYIHSQFELFPQTSFNRKMEKHLLNESANKYDEYYKKYGKDTEQIMMNEIHDMLALHRGGMTKVEIFNLIFVVLLSLFLLFLISIKEPTKMLAATQFSYSIINYGMPAYFILQFPELFRVIIATYAITNLMTLYCLSIRGFHVTRFIRKMIYFVTIILWGVFIALLLQVIFQNYYLFPGMLLIHYGMHRGIFILIDFFFGSFLGVFTGLSIILMKNKKNI